jgi:hypothetical protein
LVLDASDASCVCHGPAPQGNPSTGSYAGCSFEAANHQIKLLIQQDFSSIFEFLGARRVAAGTQPLEQKALLQPAVSGRDSHAVEPEMTGLRGDCSRSQLTTSSYRSQRSVHTGWRIAI